MNNTLLFAYNVLDDIYRRGAYASQALGSVLPSLSPRDRKAVNRMVLGVIEHNEEWNYQIARLCKKQPKAVVRTILKLGMYCLHYMQSMPTYTSVNDTVELCKAIKREQTGFVNATLKAYVDVMDDLPESGLESLSIRANMPIWMVNLYLDQYGVEEGIRLVTTKFNHTHLRWNERTYSRLKLKNFIEQNGLAALDTPHGYLVGATEPYGELINQGLVTVQALDSIYICQALIEGGGKGKVLDLCAAPGGKSVYIAEHNPQVQVTACDVHPHRVSLIESYARRMGVDNVQAINHDGTEYEEEWCDQFDYVLVDAPCSGLGVVGSNPDIVLNRTEESLRSLPVLQSRLLAVASQYVKPFGVLVYSTCTNLREENGNVVTAFLRAHPEFGLESMSNLPDNDGMLQFAPDEQGNDGFFVARMRKKV